MKPSANKQTFTITVYADDKKGILGNILIIFNRAGHDIKHLSVARTDVDQIILITLEVLLPGEQLNNILYKIEKIIEVYKATGIAVGLQQIAHFRLSNQLALADALVLLQRHGAVLTNVMDDSYIIQKTGTENDINLLYNQLDGKHLLSFCRGGLINNQSLIPLDDLFVG